MAWAVCVSSAALIAAAQQPQQPPPTFRTGVNLIRVDAYPSKDGKIIRGLKAEDFEVLEDGVVQKVESFQFVEYPQYTPAEERRDPNSQRDGFQLAADPSYRVFVVYLDNLHVDFAGSHRARVPLITFLNQVLGPKDLFGVLTTVQRPQDLMLGQQTLMIEEQLTKYWDWGRGARVLEDDHDVMLDACFPRQAGELIARRRLDEVFSDLEGIAALLTTHREERKNILIVSNGWYLPPASRRATEMIPPRMPQIGVSKEGTLTAGSRQGEISERWCQNELQRLSSIDFQLRQRDLLAQARQSNVTFYSLRPIGLAAPATVEGMRFDRESSDTLRTLSNNTDGVAIVDTNDLTGGARRIADDLSAAYLLGYYSTNAKADGRVRSLTVRLKNTGERVRARREYRAPTASEMASIRAATVAAAAPAPPAEAAFAELKRLRPGAPVHSRGTVLGNELVLTSELSAPEVEAGRWKEGADVQIMISDSGGNVLTTGRAKLEPGARAAVARIALGAAAGPFTAAIRMKGPGGEAQDEVTVQRRDTLFGDPMLVRFALPGTPRPAGSVYFRRTERMQVRWPVASKLDSREVVVLGRDGVAANLAVSVSDHEEGGRQFAVADLNLAPFTQGEYILQIKGTAGGKTETAMLAFRIFR